MKKFAKITAVVMLVVLSVMMLASCGVSQSTADKINKATSDGESMSVADAKKLCGGEPTIDLSALGTGLLVYVNGCKNLEDVNAKIEAGKTPKALYVTIAAGKAIAAVFQDYDADKKK